MRYPAFFLVGGVCSLFVGFIIGICLYYGLAVAGILALVVLSAVAFYEVRAALRELRCCFLYSRMRNPFRCLSATGPAGSRTTTAR